MRAKSGASSSAPIRPPSASVNSRVVAPSAGPTTARIGDGNRPSTEGTLRRGARSLRRGETHPVGGPRSCPRARRREARRRSARINHRESYPPGRRRRGWDGRRRRRGSRRRRASRRLDAVEGTARRRCTGFEHERGDAFATRAEEDVALQAGEILRGAAETVDEDEESGRAPRRGGGGTVERERRAGVKAETRGVGVGSPPDAAAVARARARRGDRRGEATSAWREGFASRRASAAARRGSDCGASDSAARARGGHRPDAEEGREREEEENGEGSSRERERERQPRAEHHTRGGRGDVCCASRDEGGGRLPGSPWHDARRERCPRENWRAARDGQFSAPGAGITTSADVQTECPYSQHVVPLVTASSVVVQIRRTPSRAHHLARAPTTFGDPRRCRSISPTASVSCWAATSHPSPRAWAASSLATVARSSPRGPSSRSPASPRSPPRAPTPAVYPRSASRPSTPTGSNGLSPSTSPPTRGSPRKTFAPSS